MASWPTRDADDPLIANRDAERSGVRSRIASLGGAARDVDKRENVKAYREGKLGPRDKRIY